ncbi:MAG: hypothetical protein K8S56_08605, partial [Candidatus Cloacimonetes bacterium]|nr:hypothetical protein [Candidatus Cloacimonadota bacterium]
MVRKKRDKKRFTRQNVNLKNVPLNNPDDFFELVIAEDKRAEKKIPEKSELTLKQNIRLVLARVIEVRAGYKAIVETQNGETLNCIVSGRLKQINYSTRNLLTAGDLVQVDISEEARI